LSAERGHEPTVASVQDRVLAAGIFALP